MRDTTLYRKALLDRLGELDSRLHHIETELDEPHSKDWEENAVEREGIDCRREHCRVRVAHVIYPHVVTDDQN